MRRLAPLFSLVLALGCGAPTAVQEPFGYGDPFWLVVGRSAVSDDASTIVRFVRVMGDSRCPGGDIVCVWEGEASVEIGVRIPPAGETLHEIRVGPDRAYYGVGSMQGHAIEVLALEPLGVGAPHDAIPRVQVRVVAVR